MPKPYYVIVYTELQQILQDSEIDGYGTVRPIVSDPQADSSNSCAGSLQAHVQPYFQTISVLPMSGQLSLEQYDNQWYSRGTQTAAVTAFFTDLSVTILTMTQVSFLSQKQAASRKSQPQFIV